MMNRTNGGPSIVQHLMSRARGFLVALAVLALSAGVVLAGRPATAPPAAAAGGLERATEASGQTVPAAGQAEDQAPDADEDADEDEPAEDEPGDEDAAEHPDNHGALVSAAARGETPEAFDNHGQYVKSVATANHGQEAAAAAKQGKPSH
jgi:hypothetical protein